MKIIGRIIGSIISAYVGWVLGSYIINMIKNVSNPLIRLAYLCLFVVCCVIVRNNINKGNKKIITGYKIDCRKN